MFDIELDIFSGRPNPRWTLNAAEEAELLQRLLDRTVPTAPMTITDGKLGYRGFVVRASAATAAALAARGLPTAFRVRDGLGASIDASAERWLLFTGAATGLQAPVAADRRARPVHRRSVQEAAPHELDGLPRVEPRPRLVSEQLLQLRLELAHRHVRPAWARLRHRPCATSRSPRSCAAR